ncbi:hypothetical protein DHEL01_v202471 [Diaporthe helianthi]|uniref:Ubiquitin-like protease family profile domain-containing protein n=1 Tax=Diaporthe helianthi TaxID=158607 RepID=A0A2P5I9G9_DIAHE|nr:hypothetical protein DHEL01_v202471 [Diaporthe helianthi]
MEHQPSYWAPRPDLWAPQLRRPQGLNPPPDRMPNHTHSLDQESRQAICPWNWLDDSVVNTFLQRLCSMQPGQFVTLDSATLESLRIMLSLEDLASEDFDKTIKPFRTLAATVSGNCGLVFIPFCMDKHWILAVADFRHKTIRIYDSLVQCYQNGTVCVSRNVSDYIVPLVKEILGFCFEPHQWMVENFWLPIKYNETECGVYICLMALQHSHHRMFTVNDYVNTYLDTNGQSAYYHLDGCYWLTGRRIILQFCARFFHPASPHGARDEDQSIAEQLRHYFDAAPVEQGYALTTYRMARAWTLWRVNQALTWVSTSIENLARPQDLSLNAMNHLRRAQYPILTFSGAQFRNEIVEQAKEYAWHDPEPLVRLLEDIHIAMDTMKQDYEESETRFSRRLALQAQSARGGTPSVKPSSAEDSDTSSSVVKLVATPPPSTTQHVDVTPTEHHLASPSTSEKKPKPNHTVTHDSFCMIGSCESNNRNTQSASPTL